MPALVSAVLLYLYIYRMDRVEKEPLWLLSCLFLAGAALYYPTLLGAMQITAWLDGLFAGRLEHTLWGGAAYASPLWEALHHGLCALVGIGLVEELAKWLVLVLITGRRKNDRICGRRSGRRAACRFFVFPLARRGRI